MSNFGFGDLLTKSTDELARQANISTRGDKVLIRSTYDNPEITLPSPEGETINGGAVLDALITSIDLEDKDEIPSIPKRSTYDNVRIRLPFTAGEEINAGASLQALINSGDAEEKDQTTAKILKRFLQERSFLVFEFPSEDGTRAFSILPFFENISISESQKANFAVYDLLGRAGNVYGYTGSKSRQFNLTFKMNVVHIHDMLTREGFSLQDFNQSLVDPMNKEYLRKLFLVPSSQRKSNDKLDQIALATNNFNELMSEDFFEITVPNNLRKISKTPFPNKLANIDFRPDPIQDPFLSRYAKSLKSVLWWLNLVRSSTVNNSRNAIYGPPIIRLNHGMLYNNVPCVCTSFTIRENSKTNYDVITNFAMYYDVTMSLEEVRSSTGTYEPRSINKGDVIAGWNDLKDWGTMDPYNGVWGAQ
jgi:hypothetical protein